MCLRVDDSIGWEGVGCRASGFWVEHNTGWRVVGFWVSDSRKGFKMVGFGSSEFDGVRASFRAWDLGFGASGSRLALRVSLSSLGPLSLISGQQYDGWYMTALSLAA